MSGTTCFEIDPNTSGFMTTTPGQPQSGAFLGFHGQQTAIKWKYKGASAWPSSFSIVFGPTDWAGWTGIVFTTNAGTFSSTTEPIVLDTGDQLFTSVVPGGGQMYLRRRGPVDMVFYTNVAGDYLPVGRYDLVAAPVPPGLWRFGEDQPGLSDGHRAHPKKK
jgi:hypothetical protein